MKTGRARRSKEEIAAALIVGWTCCQCGRFKNPDDFHRCPTGRLRATCKECHALRYSLRAGYRTPSDAAKKSSTAARRAAKLAAQMANGKQCRICKATKPLDAFFRSKTKFGGRDTRCKACDRAKSIEWRAKKKAHG